MHDLAQRLGGFQPVQALDQHEGFLPILGFWMIPLGLILIAIELPFLRPPLAKGLMWVEAKVWGKTE